MQGLFHSDPGDTVTGRCAGFNFFARIEIVAAVGHAGADGRISSHGVSANSRTLKKVVNRRFNNVGVVAEFRFKPVFTLITADGDILYMAAGIRLTGIFQLLFIEMPPMPLTWRVAAFAGVVAISAAITTAKSESVFSIHCPDYEAA
ncbi:MAG: hypothetical protein HGB26_07230 [Desulfobulbaceae bacterium]|nr:hypothetical protein [Desulfobulbaceae bacterium]